ncbi:MAG TPA: hypothetical protein VN306_05115, partial [Mycobacterium sp.]|nr:hypothetical protein [Mycobacterium sp.]
MRHSAPPSSPPPPARLDMSYPYRPDEQMTVQSWPAAVGFHRGELAVQRQARVEAQAARLAPMVARGQL